MKKKSIKILAVVIVIFAILSMISNVALAVAMTKDSLETNLKAYADGTKTATATLESGTTTIGGSENTATLTVDDSTIKLSSDGVEVTANYTISDTETTFSIDQSFTSDMTDENYLAETLKPASILPMAFLAVTDAQSVDSNDALEYYMEAVENGTETPSGDNTDKLATAKGTKISVDNDIFTYAQTETSNTDTEYKVTNKLTVKMNVDFSKISGESGGTLITAGGNETNTTGNEIIAENETENDVSSIGNEVFDENNTSNEILPETGPDTWIQIAIVLVSLVIIIIMVLNVQNTNQMKKQ